MQTEAIFDNIANRIAWEIAHAKQSIYIAVAWFTNKNLFSELLLKARNGCEVTLIISNDDINSNSSIDFDLLNIGNSHVYKVGNGNTELMHNKFCVIDYCTVITGSYNWSYKAESNFENIIITQNDTSLAEQFITEFNSIRKKFYPDKEIEKEQVFPVSDIVRRLEILKNFVLLEEPEELNRVADKLSAFDFNADIAEILSEIKQKEYSKAIQQIQSFISKYQQITIWTDPEIAALKLEIKNLENQLNAYDNEKTELEKILSDFQHRHTIELGEIILEILHLRKLKYKDDRDKYQEAEQDEKQYKGQFDTEKERVLFDLTEEQRSELKKKFRKATVLCHPDKVSDEYKNSAQQIFIELKDAYDSNNLTKVSEILNDLENGNYFKPKSETISQKEVLKTAIAKLRKKIKDIEIAIIEIKESETYQTINDISDWGEYFKNLKAKLEDELKRLKSIIY